MTRNGYPTLKTPLTRSTSTSPKATYTSVVYDACRARLMEIGEAVKHIDPDVLGAAPEVAWNQIARMRDVLVHHYHDTDFAVVESVIVERLPSLREAVVRLKSVGDNFQ